jgi:LytS/YehU family sensor histidine kinase
VTLRQGRCLAQVIDTGVGLQPAGDSLGTGLTTLRERLQLIFGHEAQLRLSEIAPHGVCAEMEFPARKEAA